MLIIAFVSRNTMYVFIIGIQKTLNVCIHYRNTENNTFLLFDTVTYTAD
jgi:hypothetical protein